MGTIEVKLKALSQRAKTLRDTQTLNPQRQNPTEAKRGRSPSEGPRECTIVFGVYCATIISGYTTYIQSNYSDPSEEDLAVVSGGLALPPDPTLSCQANTDPRMQRSQTLPRPRIRGPEPEAPES